LLELILLVSYPSLYSLQLVPIPTCLDSNTDGYQLMLILKSAISFPGCWRVEEPDGILWERNRRDTELSRPSSVI